MSPREKPGIPRSQRNEPPPELPAAIAHRQNGRWLGLRGKQALAVRPNFYTVVQGHCAAWIMGFARRGAHRPRMSDRAIHTCGFCAVALSIAVLLLIWHM